MELPETGGFTPAVVRMIKEVNAWTAAEANPTIVRMDS